MNKKFAVICIIITIVTVLIWIFIFPLKKPATTKNKNANIFPKEDSIKDISSISQRKDSKQENNKNIPNYTTLYFSEKEKTKPQGYTIEESLPYQKNKVNNLNNVIDSIINSVDLSLKTAQQSEYIEISTTTSETEKLDENKMDQKVFDKLFPDYIIEAYMYTQKVYIERGFLRADYEKIENFDSEEKIFAFVNININVFEEIGLITESEADKFRIGANQIWKGILEKEKLELKRQLIGTKFYKRILTNRIYHLNKSTNKKITKILKELKEKTVTKLYAADCYRSGTSALGGTNNANVPCCNCGLNCNKHGCYPVPDCGSGCDIDLGCLNLYAKGSKPAIWDPATGICGVG